MLSAQPRISATRKCRCRFSRPTSKSNLGFGRRLVFLPSGLFGNMTELLRVGDIGGLVCPFASEDCRRRLEVLGDLCNGDGNIACGDGEKASRRSTSNVRNWLLPVANASTVTDELSAIVVAGTCNNREPG